jgi:hypothetical protein
MYGSALLLSAHIVWNVLAVDPFEKANQLYAESKWEEAAVEYTKVHEDIDTRKQSIDLVDKENIIRGHVNYSDVLFSLSAGALSKKDYTKAQTLMAEACKHREWRLHDGQFGREPIKEDEELDWSNLKGKRVLVRSERKGGALGDTFYETDLLRHLKEKGAYVILAVQNPLIKLYQLKGSKQAQYVDEVISANATELPMHEKKIYLWSILKHALSEQQVQHIFPKQPSLSGGDVTEFTELIKKRSGELHKIYGKEPLIVGFWWRGAGDQVRAADWRKLSRDPGADRLLKIFKGLPILAVNIEGMGRKILSEAEYRDLESKNKLGISDLIDVTEEDRFQVLNLPANFDKAVPFADTLGIMEWAKEQNGLLIGCDTSLANAAAAVENKSTSEKSVYVMLNKKADMRWSDSTKSPRDWHHSDDVKVFQAQEQGDWNPVIEQIREMIKQKIAERDKK